MNYESHRSGSSDFENGVLIIRDDDSLRASDDDWAFKHGVHLTPSFRYGQDEFCTYMQLEYSKREECALRRKQAAFSLPAKVKPFTHGEPVLRIRTVSDGTVVTLREDGSVQYWSPELRLQKSKTSLFVCIAMIRHIQHYVAAQVQ